MLRRESSDVLPAGVQKFRGLDLDAAGAPKGEPQELALGRIERGLPLAPDGVDRIEQLEERRLRLQLHGPGAEQIGEKQIETTLENDVERFPAVS